MFIDQLIEEIKPHIPFASEESAQNFVDKISEDDRSALMSAMYLGREHLHSDKFSEEYLNRIKSDDMNRNSLGGDVSDEEVARVLFEKNTLLASYYEAFLRCAANSGFNLKKF